MNTIRTKADPDRTRILVADDVSLMRDLLRSVLRSLGHNTIVEAADGDQALREFESIPRPHIAFLDINMPHKDGLDVLQELRKAYPETFAVIVSAEGTIENIRKAMSCGADAFVVKPYQGVKIQEALDKYYRKAAERAG